MKKFILSFSMLFFASCSGGNDTIPKAKIPEPKTDNVGYEYKSGVVLSSKYAPLWVQHLVTGYKKHSLEFSPSKLTVSSQISGCKFEPKNPNSMLVNIYIPKSFDKINLMNYSEEDLSDSVARFISVYKSKGDKALERPMTHFNSMMKTDVFVNEKSKPIHLVLTGAHKIWNINAFEGTNVERISVIGFGAGVANAPSTAKVEFMSQDKLRICKVLPARKPQDHWLFVKRGHNDIKDKHNLRA